MNLIISYPTLLAGNEYYGLYRGSQGLSPCPCLGTLELAEAGGLKEVSAVMLQDPGVSVFK